NGLEGALARVESDLREVLWKGPEWIVEERRRRAGFRGFGRASVVEGGVGEGRIGRASVRATAPPVHRCGRPTIAAFASVVRCVRVGRVCIRGRALGGRWIAVGAIGAARAHGRNERQSRGGRVL